MMTVTMKCRTKPSEGSISLSSHHVSPSSCYLDSFVVFVILLDEFVMFFQFELLKCSRVNSIEIEEKGGNF